MALNLADLALVTYPALLGVAMYFCKRWMDNVSTKIDKYGDQQRVCQLSLVTTFRTKTEAEKEWGRHLDDESEQDKRIDDLHTRVTRLETAGR